MSNMMPMTPVVAALLIAVCALPLAHSATSAIVNVGTLTCTVQPAPPDSGSPAVRDLSCNFTPATGIATELTEARLAGVVSRTSGPPLKDTQLVLIWSVLAARPDITLRDLEGRYLSSLSSAPAPSARSAEGVLSRRNGDDVIELHTTTPIGGTSERTLIFELQLSALKA